MKHGHRILFLGVEDWLMVERLPLLLHEAGFSIAAISRKGTALDVLPWTLHRHWGGDGNVLRTIDSTVEAFNPDLLIPLDEASVQLLGFILRKNPDNFAARHARLLQKSFGDISSIRLRIRRASLIALPEEIRIPDTVSSEDPEKLMAFGRSVAWNCMFKTEGSAAGTGVFRCDDEISFSRHAKFLADRNKAFVVQRFIPGRYAMRTAAALQGEVLCGISLERLASNHAFGYSTVVKALHHAGMTETIARLASTWGISGIFSGDFIVDAANVAWLIEVNPRPTTTLHLGPRVGVDFSQALADIVTGVARIQTDNADNQRPLAMFPKEWLRSPVSEWLTTADNDIPWNHPNLVAHYAQMLERKK